MTKQTISAQWLKQAADKFEASAMESLPTLALLGQMHKHTVDMEQIAAMRRAAEIKSISARRQFLKDAGLFA
ncbi:hypothetical protein [Rhodopseudomonas sp. WA056]|uniref:hypothetical protein n=1 Tax=Rhodopseudomonas sp. WA056 TaxID=2269367 RepID=UPI0013E03878|nr:hypothetical protein [Rhodopseudomonas sp. WA056]